MKISFHVKTNLTYDGRVLASIDAISEAYPESDIRVSLLPDGPTKVDLPFNAWIDEISIPFRVNRFRALFRILTVLWYTFVDLKRTIAYKPDVIHLHDKTAAFAPFLYRLLLRKHFVFIYDDHEIFNRPISLQEKIFWRFEKMIANSADVVVVANYQRGRLLKRLYSLSRMPIVVENLYYDRLDENKEANTEFEEIEFALNELKSKGIKLLLHQGRLLEDRGAALLESIPSSLPDDWALCIIGVAESDFKISSLAKRDNVLFLGRIKFELLPKVYSYMDGAAIFYLPKKLNNRYCAPNRLYQAISFGLPLVVNAGNPVLSDVVRRYSNGVCLRGEDSLNTDMKEYFAQYDKLKHIADSVTQDFDFKISAEKYVSIYRENLKY